MSAAPSRRRDSKDAERPFHFHPRDYADLLLIGSAHGLSDGFSHMLVPVLALIVAELGLQAFKAGLLLSAFSVSAFLFVYPISAFADHSGRKKYVIISGMLLSSVCFAGMQWAGAFAPLLLLSFVAGSGNATYHSCGTALVADRFPEKKSLAISVHGLMGSVGASAIPAIQALVAQAAGWRNAILACTMPAAVLIPMLAWRYPNRSPGAARGTRSGVWKSLSRLSKQVLGNRNVLLLAAVYALKEIGTKPMIGFFPILAAEKLGMSTTVIGLGITLYFAAAVAAKPLLGYAYHRWGPRAALSLPLLLSGAIALAVGLVPVGPLVMAMLAAAGGASSISPAVLTAAVDVSDKESLSSAIGFIYTCHGLAFAGPAIGGLMIQLWGIEANYVLCAGAICAASLVASFIGGPRR